MISLPIASRVREKARQVDCKSNLRQLGVAITTYRNDNHGKNPAWLSSLFPRYIDDKSVFVCKTDINRGLKRTRPKGLQGKSTQDYPETIDNESNSSRNTLGANLAIKACSYFYEFSAAPCAFGAVTGWPEGILPSPHTWSDWKSAQLEFGDENSGTDANGDPLPYGYSRMPIIRCYHHFDRSSVPG